MSANTLYVRYHSSDDMTGVGELAAVTEPVAVVLRPDGSADVYGCVAIVDQRCHAASNECAECGHELEKIGTAPDAYEHARLRDSSRNCICLRRDEACWPAAGPGSQVRAPGYMDAMRAK